MKKIDYNQNGFKRFKKDYINFISYKLNIDSNSPELNALLFDSPEKLIEQVENETLLIDDLKKQINYDLITRTNESEDTKRKYKFYQYKSFRDRILHQFDVSVCPYCNRNYINVIEDTVDDSTRSLGVLDHYYPKDEKAYPYLSLNLYNFIPACTTCNSKFKLSNTTEILNPFLDDFNEIFKFKLDTDDLPDILVHEKPFKIIIETKGLEKEEIANNTKSLFRLEDIYNYHNKDAKDIIIKSLAFTDKYINGITNTLRERLDTDLSIDTKELIFGLTDDINNTPLSKFKNDIYNQFNPNKKRSIKNSKWKTKK